MGWDIWFFFRRLTQKLTMRKPDFSQKTFDFQKMTGHTNQISSFSFEPKTWHHPSTWFGSNQSHRRAGANDMLGSVKLAMPARSAQHFDPQNLKQPKTLRREPMMHLCTTDHWLHKKPPGRAPAAVAGNPASNFPWRQLPRRPTQTRHTGMEPRQWWSQPSTWHSDLASWWRQTRQESDILLLTPFKLFQVILKFAWCWNLIVLLNLGTRKELLRNQIPACTLTGCMDLISFQLWTQKS